MKILNFTKKVSTYYGSFSYIGYSPAFLESIVIKLDSTNRLDI